MRVPFVRGVVVSGVRAVAMLPSNACQLDGNRKRNGGLYVVPVAIVVIVVPRMVVRVSVVALGSMRLEMYEIRVQNSWRKDERPTV